MWCILLLAFLSEYYQFYLMTQVIIFADTRGLRSLGPYRIASEIRQAGFSCQIISFINFFNHEELEKICNKFITSETLLVGFGTTFWYEDLSPYKFIIDTICKINPNIKMISGGPNAERFSVKINRKLDAIFLGQADYIIIKYLQHIVNGNTLPAPTRIREKWVISPVPVYELLDITKEWDFNHSQTMYVSEDCISPGEPLVLEVARGCIFKCKFCSFPLTGKKKLDHIKYAETLYEELIRNYQNHGTHHYILSDDTFNDSLEKLKILKEVFLSLPFKLTFSCYARLDLLNAHKEEIELFEEMGMTGVNFGVESFHDKAAKFIGKGISGETAKNLLYDLKHKYWKNRIKVAIGLIQGIPYETYDSYEKTLNWVLDESNLIETILPAPLIIIDPKASLLPYDSEFTINANKYGFYWLDNESEGWKNMTGPVKSYKEAIKLSNQINDACVKTKRTDLSGGGFALSRFYMFSTYSDDPKNFNELVSMDRIACHNYMEKNELQNHRNFMKWYKFQLFNL
jgi:hypothetical protein